VGSKSYWVEDVRFLTKDFRDFVEPFCGSAILSANCAKTAILNDLDPLLCFILERFDEQIVPDIFTREMFYQVRGSKEWWKYAFCLSRMAFSGIFRHTEKGGFNVQAKTGKNYEQIAVRGQYLAALAQWKKLKPTIRCGSYEEIDPLTFEGKTVIFDPPYAGSVAWDNWCQNLGSRTHFNYVKYWEYVNESRKYAEVVIIFDKRENLVRRFNVADIVFYKQKKLHVNGKYSQGVDAMISLTILK
jgi:site-specific DNA-adenine methylase